MAWARRLPSKRWQACYRDASGRTRTAGSFARKGDAETAAEDQESALRRGEWIDPDLRRATVGGLAEKWYEGARHTLKPKTVASYRSLLSSRVLPAFGRHELRAVRPSEVTTWVGTMVAEGLSPSRIRQAHVVLRLVLDCAVRDGYLNRNPAAGVKLPRLEHREAPYFEPPVVDTLVDAIGAPYDVLVAVLGTVGLRWGEALALRGRHVDTLRRRLVVEESLAEISGRLVFGNTKSHARRRVPVPASLLARIPAVGTDELVFTAPEGGPLRYNNFVARVWHPALAKLGLPKLACTSYAIVLQPGSWPPGARLRRCRLSSATEARLSRSPWTGTSSTPTSTPWPIDSTRGKRRILLHICCTPKTRHPSPQPKIPPDLTFLGFYVKESRAWSARRRL
jgi:integrase